MDSLGIKEKKTDRAVSVIIPMYNCEDYVPNLFKLFSEQSFTDFEVICVIDGATDSTEEAVRKFRETDARFRFVVQENRGPGAARNTGIDEARGRYIIFPDADDEYSEHYLKRLYDTAIEYDAQITICRFTEKDYRSQTIMEWGFDKKKFVPNTIYSHKDINNIFTSVMSRITNKLYNSDFLRMHRLRFPELRAGEDSYFCCASLAVADRIVVISDNLMTYRLHFNPDSCCSTRGKVQHDAVDSLRLLYQWLKSNNCLDVHKEDFMLKVNASLKFDGGYQATPRYISEVAHMLNAEEPFDTMTSGEILKYLENSLFPNKEIGNEADVKNGNHLKLTNGEKDLISNTEAFINRLHVAELIRQVSKERYGRDFERKDSLSTDSA